MQRRRLLLPEEAVADAVPFEVTKLLCVVRLLRFGCTPFFARTMETRTRAASALDPTLCEQVDVS